MGSVMSDYLTKDCLFLSNLLKNGECSPKELLEECIRAQKNLGIKVNALSSFDPELALDSISSERHRNSFFGGIPFVVKDAGILVNGMKTTYGSENRQVHVMSNRDSDLIKRYRDCGFIICGRSNTSEFGLSPITESNSYGITANPWNYGKTSGGSSGGSAAAVASGIVPIAHGADGGGSIRVPASCCGLFGLKPSRGRTNVEIDQPAGWGGFISHHVITRSVRDSAAVLNLTESQLYKDRNATKTYYNSFNDINKPRLVFALDFKSLFFIDHEIRCRVEYLAQELMREKYQVECVDLEYDPLLLRSYYRKFISRYVKSFLETKGVKPQHYESLMNLEAATLRLLEESLTLNDEDIVEVNLYFQKIESYFTALFKRFDILITPCLATLPPNVGYFSKFESSLDELHEEYARFSPYTIPFNINGFPSASIPCGKSREGTPIGVQIISNFGNDEAVLMMAAKIEKLGLYNFSKEILNKNRLLGLI